MGYRRGYYRKDGTYVRGHYANTGRRATRSNNKNGCASSIILFITILIILIVN